MLNKKGIRGWTLSGEYLAYRKGGGYLSPEDWNQRVKELKTKGE